MIYGRAFGLSSRQSPADGWISRRQQKAAQDLAERTTGTISNAVMKQLTITLLGVALATPALSSELASNTPARFTLGYEVYAGGLKGVEFEYRLEMKDGGYRTDFEGEIVGTYGWFIDFSLNSAVEGDLREGAPQPRSYLLRSQWNDNPPRAIDMVWGEDRLPLAEVKPEPEDDERQEVPEELRLGAVDPLTAVLSLSQTLAETGSCTSTAEVFDGRRRFDLVASDGGAATIEANDYQVYQGPAQRCVIRFEPIAGFKEETDDGKPEEKRYDKDIRVFLAPVAEGLPPLPVRMEFDHRLGSVRVHLASISQD